MRRMRAAVAMLACFIFTLGAHAQSSANFTQTVNQRATIGVLTATPASGAAAGDTISFGYILHTAGAPAPASQTIQFYDGGTALGAAQSLGSISTSNLLPNSQLSLSNGWNLTGTAATLSANAASGPDGSTASATKIAFPATAGGSSGVTQGVTGTSYAGKAMTFSIWAKAAPAATLTLTLTDWPSSSASSSASCALTTDWQRCVLTYTFPANAGTGFAAAIAVSGQAATSVNVWGAQVEQAAAAGPYVSTIGTARASGGQGASVTFLYSLFHAGTHVITAGYAGDTNFLASTSNAVTLVIGKATPAITLTANPAAGSVYGQSVTFAAQLAGPSGNPADMPSGTVQFMDGATALGSGTISAGGVATLTLSGAASLSAGSHSITAIYSGDSEFLSVTSQPLSYSVSKASNLVTIAVTSSLNPSTYGDSITLSIAVTSAAGAVPTGSVMLMDGQTNLGTGTLDASGHTSVVVPLLAAGTHTITVTYSGDSNYD